MKKSFKNLLKVKIKYENYNNKLAKLKLTSINVKLILTIRNLLMNKCMNIKKKESMRKLKIS